MPKTSTTRISITFIHLALWTLFTVALGLALWNFIRGDAITSLFSAELAGVKNIFELRIDTISTLMLLMITLLGGIIGKYSLRYLHREVRQVYFYSYLLLTIISASLLVLANDLIMLLMMWLLSSFGLHKLLVYYPERKQAVAAAWKKFFVSRFGDVALLAAIILTYQTFGTFNFSQLFSAANAIVQHSFEAHRLSIIGILFVFGAISKSAQFPFHFWLPETMETPAPVSALMHAGIINAGGFLIIRLSPLLQNAEVALLILTFFGSITAVFGALVMITQNDIKKKLAFSTVSQMGVMMVACGLGAYSLALFHIIAHSFYKAHAFLSTGFLVTESKKVKFNHSSASPLLLLSGVFAGYALIAIGSAYFELQYVAYFSYAAILLLGFVQNIDFDERSSHKLHVNFFGILLLTLAFSFGVCFAVEAFLHHKLADYSQVTPGYNGRSIVHVIACFSAYTVFAIGLGLSALLMQSKAGFIQKIYLYFWNAGYFSQRTSLFLNIILPKKGLRS